MGCCDLGPDPMIVIELWIHGDRRKLRFISMHTAGT